MLPNELLCEIESLKSALASRDAELSERTRQIAKLEVQIEALLAELKKSSRDNHHLVKRLEALLSHRRALRGADNPAQGKLEFLQEPAPIETPEHASEAPDGETSADPIKRKNRTKNPAREIAYQGLERRHIQHELPEEKRVCPVSGLKLLQVGEKLFEELEYQPGKLFLNIHHLPIYGPGPEQAQERTIEPIVTPTPVRPIENGLVGAGLLAWILVQKYRHHLPLYRQEAIFAREGLLLPRQSMCDWVMAAAALLGPIQRAMQREIVTSGVVQCDDTPVVCQLSKGQGKAQAYLWVYVSPLVEGVVYDFSMDREHVHVKDFLQGMACVLVGDGYAGFKTIARAGLGVVEAGCWAHAIRKFRDAVKDAPKEASEMMSLIAMLFRIEEQATAQGLDFEQRRELRQRESKAALEQIDAQAKELSGRFSEQEKLSEALKYLKNQWPTLVVFLDDGRVPIHNNACENAIRPLAVGRRNWLFAGSERGGAAAATIYSVIESCKMARVDPYLYLKDVLVRVATHNANRVGELIPARWKVLFGASASA